MPKLSIVIPSRDEQFLISTIDDMGDDFHWTAEAPPCVRGQTGYLYLVRNLVNGKQYVGQTRRTLSQRWTSHQQAAIKASTAISYAISKYGAWSFQVEPLCRVDSRELTSTLDGLEKYFIRTLNTLWPNGYNIHVGGRGGPMDDSTKEKLRQAHLGRKASPETRAKMSAVRKGRKLSPEHAAAIRRIDRSRITYRRGFTISEAQRAQVSAVHKGKVLSAETRAKISAKLKGLKQSPETIAKRVVSIAAAREKKKLVQGVSTDSQS